MSLEKIENQDVAEPDPGTFKERVEAFWQWYAGVGQRFFDEIEAGQCSDLQPETSEVSRRLFPGFDWVFGPGPSEKGGHSFTLSGNGNPHRQFLTEYWAKRAPELTGWTFYSSRQPGDRVESGSITIDDIPIKFSEVWLTPVVDVDNETIHITAWHADFEKIDKRKFMILYLMLDEVLGEYGTDASIGKVEIGDEKLADAIPLSELREFTKRTEQENNWKRYPPTESFTSYSVEEPSGDYLRADTFVGTTSNFKLVQDYSSAEGDLDDPLDETGAEFVFIAMDRAILPKGSEVEFRGEIEDGLDNQLRESWSGQVLGGASGTDYCYIDVLLVDGERSLQILLDTLKEMNLPTGTAVHFFAKGNEGRRLYL